jgi:hypothetical protein
MSLRLFHAASIWAREAGDATRTYMRLRPGYRARAREAYIGSIVGLHLGGRGAEDDTWGKERSVPRRIASPAVAAALCVLLAACGRDPVGKFDDQVEACQSAAPGTLAVGSLTAPEAGVIYCAAHDDMDRITSGEVPVEDVAQAVVKLGANGKWYVASS